jgi:hypothetical protein
MQLTEAIEAKEQPPEFVFPSEHAFNRPEALFKYRRLEQRLAASLGLFSAARIRVDVGIMPRLKMALRLRRQS